MDRTKDLLADPETLIFCGILVFATIVIATLIGKNLERMLEKKSKDQNIDITRFAFLKKIIIVTIYFFGFGWAFLTLPVSKGFAQSLLAGAGASTLILGFASQKILSNILSGFFLVMKRPFRINDIIEVNGNRGKVVELNLHNTTIVDEDMVKIIIPNSVISNGIIKKVYGANEND